MNVDELCELAEHAVDAALDAGARSAEAYVAWDHGLSVDLEGGSLKTGSSGTELAVGLRVLSGGRLGRASGPARELDALARQALGGALAAPEGLAFADGTGSRTSTRYRAPSTEEVVEDALVLLETAEAHGVEATGGGVGHGAGVWALATSEGFLCAVEEGLSEGGLSCVAEADVPGAGHESGWARQRRLDAAAIAKEAARQALASRDPGRLDRSLARVVFHPDALSGLLGSTLLPALDAARMARRESPLVTTDGPLAGEGVSVLDVGPREDTLFLAPFDDEGTPLAPRAYIADGVLASGVAAREDRARHGLDIEGWAHRWHGLFGRGPHGDPSASPGQLVVDAPRATREELLAEAGEALYVRDVIGAHTANATTGRFAVEATQAFRVRGGAVAEAVSGALVAGTLVELLVGMRLSSEPVVQDGWSAPGLQLGEVLVEGLAVTPRGG